MQCWNLNHFPPFTWYRAFIKGWSSLRMVLTSSLCCRRSHCLLGSFSRFGVCGRGERKSRIIVRFYHSPSQYVVLLFVTFYCTIPHYRTLNSQTHVNRTSSRRPVWLCKTTLYSHIYYFWLFAVVEKRESPSQLPLLFPCGNLRKDTLPEKLTAAGFALDEVLCYNTCAANDIAINAAALVKQKVSVMLMSWRWEDLCNN